MNTYNKKKNVFISNLVTLLLQLLQVETYSIVLSSCNNLNFNPSCVGLLRCQMQCCCFFHSLRYTFVSLVLSTNFVKKLCPILGANDLGMIRLLKARAAKNFAAQKNNEMLKIR